MGATSRRIISLAATFYSVPTATRYRWPHPLQEGPMAELITAFMFGWMGCLLTNLLAEHFQARATKGDEADG